MEAHRPYDYIKKEPSHNLNHPYLKDQLPSAGDTHPNAGIHRDHLSPVKKGFEGANDVRVGKCHAVQEKYIAPGVETAKERVKRQLDLVEADAQGSPRKLQKLGETRRAVTLAAQQTTTDLLNCDRKRNSLDQEEAIEEDEEMITSHLQKKKDFAKRYHDTNLKYHLPSNQNI